MGNNIKTSKMELEENVFRTCRSLAAVLLIYIVGWMGFHWIWAFSGFFIYMFWKNQKRRHKERKAIFKLIAGDEKTTLLQYKDLPGWVCFPDIQRAEWLNQMIHQMWPFISDLVCKVLKEEVEPEVKKNLPSLLKSFHFVEVDLGNQPLRLGGIKVYTEHVKPTEIIIDAEIIYAGDAVVKIGFGKGISGGISDLQIRGTIRIELSPLLPKSPLIGAVTLYFLETPEFEFDLTQLLNMFDVPGLSSIFRGAIEEAIDSFIVLPRRITVPIADEKSLQLLKYPMPLGVLHVKIIEATGLEAKDKKFFQKDSSDPFVVVKVGKFKYQTKVSKDTITPKWHNESFTVFVERVVGQKIHFELKDEDNIQNDTLGYAEQSLEGLWHSKTKDYTYMLENGKGSLHCELEWLVFSEEVTDINKVPNVGMASKTCLFVKLEHCIGLPAVKMDTGTSSPHIELIVGKKIVKSKTKRNTTKPVWNEMHYFFIDNPKDQMVHFKILEESDEKEPLGTYDFNVSTLLSQPGMKTSQNFSLKNCFTDAYLAVTLELKALISSTDSAD